MVIFALRLRLRLRFRWLLAALGWLALACGPALAQDWPARPITFIVPSAAGGSPDVLSRILTHELAQVLGTPVVVENKPGAAGNIGILQLRSRPADGYTVAYGNVNTLAVNPSLFKKLPYSVGGDLVPIMHAFNVYNVLIVRADSPHRTVGQLIDAARRAPGKLSFGAPGVGTTGHMGGELFREMAGIDVLFVPYNGGPAALQDLLGGRIDYLFANSSEVESLVKSGKVLPLGVSSRKRLALLPDVPTLDEAGLPGYETIAWGGVVARRGTPDAVVQRLNAALRTVLGKPAVREAMLKLGAEPAQGSPQEFQALIERETARWADITARAGIEKLD